MRLYTFFAEIQEDKASIDDRKEINHLKNVLRLKKGTLVRLIDGKYEYKAKIEILNSKQVSLSIIEKSVDIYSLSKPIDVFFCITKQSSISEAVKHLTEIGVSAFFPTLSRFSFKSPNTDKLSSISRESSKQCLAVKSMKIEKSVKIEEINFDNYDLFIFAKERDGSKAISQISNLIGNAHKIAFIIGPEGGFSREEKSFLEKKAIPISLGDRIYRSETAAVAVASLIKEFL
ncbi:MAG TPA: hypothetical protein DEP20_00900 [Fusobacteria bacterium]|nr:hypothetical protein [Fusobacteriota bacterium]